METNFIPSIPYRWARTTTEDSYEVSSNGDKRFSALVARLLDGRTIEEAYQLDVKGYRRLGSDWRLGKGKPPMIPTNDLPKITSHYFELKNDKFNIFTDLLQLANVCSKLICNEILDKSVKDFIRIVRSEHSSLVNSTEYDPDDIVLCLLDADTATINPDLWVECLNALKAAGNVGVLSFVTLTKGNGLSYMNPTDKLAEFISPKYTEIPNTGYFIDLYGQYKQLWQRWVFENMDTFTELARNAHGKVLTDVFATTTISQARALCDILNKFYKLKD